MPYVKPAIQAGVNLQGTQVQVATSWFDGNLVRWRLGLLEKIKGWERLFFEPFQATIRKLHAWFDLGNLKNLMVASDLGLEILIQNTKYLLVRGTNYLPITETWYLDNLGQNGLALAQGGPLELYSPPISGGAVTTIVATAPSISNGMLVAMPQAQVVLWGTQPIIGTGGIDPLLIRWSDVGTYNVWAATVSNQAGSYRLSRGSVIVGGIQAPQTTLLFTDIDVWSMSYIGPPLIYGFTVMGTGCGLIADDAVATLGRTTFWLAEQGFWQVGDTGVQPLLCTVYDYIFNDLDTANVQKCFAAANSTSNEVAFFFPSAAVGRELLLGENLLFYSQELWQASRWIGHDAVTTQVGSFTALYVYEPQYVGTAWLDDSGKHIIGWHDRDVQGVPTSSFILAPDGSPTAAKLTELATTAQHYSTQTIRKQSERSNCTYSIYVHNTSTRNLTLRAATVGGSVFVTFNVVTGVMAVTGTTPSGFTLISWEVSTDALATGSGGNGWWRCSITFTTDDSPTLDLSLVLTSGTTLSYLGTGQFAYVWGAQLNLGSDLLDYEPTDGIIVENECTHYVKYNVVEKAWDKGVLERTAWLDNSIWGTPLGSDANYRVQQHERGFDDDDQPMRNVFAETGYAEISDGSQIMLIDEVQPDFKWAGRDGAVSVTLRATNYAGGPTQVFGPYSMTATTQYFSTRARARYLAIRYDWEPRKGYSARVGAVTYRVKPAGRLP